MSRCLSYSIAARLKIANKYIWPILTPKKKVYQKNKRCWFQADSSVLMSVIYLFVSREQLILKRCQYFEMGSVDSGEQCLALKHIFYKLFSKHSIKQSLSVTLDHTKFRELHVRNPIQSREQRSAAIQISITKSEFLQVMFLLKRLTDLQFG